MAVRIQPFQAAHAPHAAELVAARVAELRAAAPAVPPDFTEPTLVETALARSVADGHGVVALAADGRVLGHLCWHEFPTIRRVLRRAAHIPEYGCAIAPHAPAGTRDQLFAAAAQAWERTARQTVAVTQLVGEPAADEFWIDNGFGRFLHDGVRACTPIDAPLPAGFSIRAATPNDVDALVELDREHSAHYALPPTFMVPPTPATADELAALLSDHDHPVLWVADATDTTHVGPQAYLRAEQGADSCSKFLRGPDTVAITGIFTRPAARGRGVGAALLDAALRHHATRGVSRFAFDHETINPTARAFWQRHLTTVARSYLRAFERS